MSRKVVLNMYNDRNAYADAVEKYILADRQSRPRTRGECEGGPRPCPHTSCKYHLFLDVLLPSGSIQLNYPDMEPHELEHSCALDVADTGGVTLETIAPFYGTSRERIRQIEEQALSSMRDRMADGYTA